MTDRRTLLPLLVLGALLASVLAAAADHAEWQAASETVSLPPFRTGDLFRYDVAVVDPVAGLDASAAGQVTIAVGPVVEKEKGDERTALFDLRVTRANAPWDRSEREPVEPGRTPASVRISSVDTYWLRTSDGAVVWHDQDREETEWYGGDEPRLHHMASDRFSTVVREDGFVRALGDLHRGPLQVTPASLLPWGDERSGPVATPSVESGVYIVRERIAHDGPGCPLVVPPVGYSATNGRSEEIARTLWFDREHPVPLFAACERETADGVLRVAAVLIDTERGTTVIQPDWSAAESHLTQAKGFPVPLRHPGWPILDDPFRFPLEDVWSELRADPHLAGFFDDGPVPAIPLDLQYRPSTKGPSCGTDGVARLAACRSMIEETSGQETGPVTVALWSVLMMNAAGDLRYVVLQRTFVGDHPAETTVHVVTPSDDLAPVVPVDVGALPTALVPPKVVVKDFLHHVQVDQATWRDRPGSTFHVHYDLGGVREDGAYPVTYMLTVGAAPSGSEPLPAAQTDVFLRGGGPPPSAYAGDPETCHLMGDEKEGPAADGTGPLLFGTSTSTSPSQADGESWLVCWQRDHVYRAGDGALLEKGEHRYEGCHDRPHAHAIVPASTMRFPLAEDARPLAAAVVAVGLSFTALGAALAGWLRRVGPYVLLAPLFTKLDRDRLLKHGTREEIVSFVRENPGVATEEVRKHTGIGWGTVVYHLSALEQHGVIVSTKVGRHRSWFLPGSGNELRRQAMAVLQSQATRRVYETILAAPGSTQQEVAGEIGVTHGSVIFQVGRLQRVGLIRKEREGRFVRYWPEGQDPPA
ncbi:MAG: hypothetical protein KY455_11130 [Euryarchaeota archaeon]|nr:hypothetical protein [Euryarchaeota archaeon]